MGNLKILKKKSAKYGQKTVKKPKKCLNLLKTLYLKRPILQNKTMTPIFLIYSIRTGHILVVKKSFAPTVLIF